MFFATKYISLEELHFLKSSTRQMLQSSIVVKISPGQIDGSAADIYAQDGYPIIVRRKESMQEKRYAAGAGAKI
jgi:hypothetical protein